MVNRLELPAIGQDRDYVLSGSLDDLVQSHMDNLQRYFNDTQWPTTEERQQQFLQGAEQAVRSYYSQFDYDQDGLLSTSDFFRDHGYFGQNETFTEEMLQHGWDKKISEINRDVSNRLDQSLHQFANSDNIEYYSGEYVEYVGAVDPKLQDIALKLDLSSAIRGGDKSSLNDLGELSRPSTGQGPILNKSTGFEV